MWVNGMMIAEFLSKSPINPGKQNLPAVDTYPHGADKATLFELSKRE
jgi:hypothetical protein